jgi:hypothetical protein
MRNEANTSSSTGQPGIEKIGEGISLKCLYDKRIAIYTFNNPSAEDVDEWAARALELDYNFAAQRLGSIYDLSATSNQLTPYMRERITGVLRALPEIPLHLAIVTPRAWFGGRQSIQKSIEREVCENHPQLDIAFFRDRDEGLNWLEQMLVAPV